MRIAAALSSLILGLGFGIPGAIGMRHLWRTGEIWHFLGFPTYGGGPFERIGVSTTVGLLAGFLVVCVAEVMLGVLIWLNAPYVSVLGWVLLPFELVFWLGFALPVGPVLGAVRTILVLVHQA